MSPSLVLLFGLEVERWAWLTVVRQDPGEGRFFQRGRLCGPPLKRGLCVRGNVHVLQSDSGLSSFAANARAVTWSAGVRSGAPGPPADLASLWGDLGQFERAASWACRTVEGEGCLVAGGAVVVLGGARGTPAPCGIPRSESGFISSHKAGRADPEQNCELKTRQSHAVLLSWGLVRGRASAPLTPAWVLPLGVGVGFDPVDSDGPFFSFSRNAHAQGTLRGERAQSKPCPAIQ